MNLIIDTINIENLKNLDTIIFLVGIAITFPFFNDSIEVMFVLKNFVFFNKIS